MTVRTLLTENARLREDRRNLREVLSACDDFIAWARCAGGTSIADQCDKMQDKVAEIMEATKE